MLIIFCADPLSPRKPDPTYAAEYQAAREVEGFELGLVVLENLIYNNDAVSAIRSVPAQNEPLRAIYRGWMLKPKHYEMLHDALASRNIHLVTSPTAYRHTHYLPESYPIIEPYTAQTVWRPVSPDTQMGDILPLLKPFGDQPVILKDYVKSQKHYWAEACFIPHASDDRQAENVIRRFLELQGDDLNEGVVFRAYANLELLGIHIQSQMPIAREYRLFFWENAPLISAPYWEKGDSSPDTPPIDFFASIARHIQSPFFTMDVAKRRDGEWMIIELGDAQVAGLPTQLTPLDFYIALKVRQ